MYDAIRWILLVLLFAGLFGTWFWSRRYGVGAGSLGGVVSGSLKILQKRWLDQRTGVALVEAENQTFLLAYTVGGGVSWQPIEKAGTGTKVTSAPLAAPSSSVETRR